MRNNELLLCKTQRRAFTGVIQAVQKDALRQVGMRGPIPAFLRSLRLSAPIHAAALEEPSGKHVVADLQASELRAGHSVNSGL